LNCKHRHIHEVDTLIAQDSAEVGAIFSSVVM
jgi:hypothetical protein